MRVLVVHLGVFALSCSGGQDSIRSTNVVSALEAPPTTPRNRHVVFAGAPVSISAGWTPPLTVSPALPAPLAVDARTGVITGAPATPGSGVYRIRDAKQQEHTVSISVVPTPRDTDRFVATTGDDASPGTKDKPFRTIRRALERVPAGTTVFLRAGTYAEDVKLHNLHGTKEQPIVLRSYPGEAAMISGHQAQITWARAGADGAPDEWISNEKFERAGPESTSRGALGSLKSFTRLLTYSRVEDLRAINQRWDRDNDTLPGTSSKKGVRLPWTYFGPGLWHDPETGKVHLRLSPTTIGAPSVVDYPGPTDPSKVVVNVWSRSSTPLEVTHSSDIEFHDFVVRGGGDQTMQIEGSERITMDHVDIDAASIGLEIKRSTSIKYLHGRIDGGIPPWTFRSDFKDSYKMVLPDGTSGENNLVRKTSRALMVVGDGNRDLEFGYCELTNGHDIYLAGLKSEIHHCLIRNIHDEALFISHTRDISDLRIHDNVFERVLSAISGIGNKESGPRYIYRNIFDLRDPTQSYRPGSSGTANIWRWGGMFKGHVSSAPFFFYQNTVLLKPEKAGQPALLHYRNLTSDSFATWFLNNVVVVGGTELAPFAFQPDSQGSGVDRDGRKLVYSDGNVWVRAGSSKQPLFTCVADNGRGRCRTRNWRTQDALRSAGYEKNSWIGEAPPFHRFTRADASTTGDDLRPAANSPARRVAVTLPAELPDRIPAARRRDAGALESGEPKLHVGVDGRFSY